MCLLQVITDWCLTVLLVTVTIGTIFFVVALIKLALEEMK